MKEHGKENIFSYGTFKEEGKLSHIFDSISLLIDFLNTSEPYDGCIMFS